MRGIRRLSEVRSISNSHSGCCRAVHTVSQLKRPPSTPNCLSTSLRLSRRKRTSTCDCTVRAQAVLDEPLATALETDACRPDTFRCQDLQTELRESPAPRTPLQELKFGAQFTDHMFHAEHASGEGWSRPRLLPFGFLPVHPAAQAIQYGMSCFEGMKAYRGPDGRVYLFRPEMNVARFYSSSRRLGLADFDPQELLACLKRLVSLDQSWVPSSDGYSLYIRPFMFASSFSLGVSAPSRSTVSIICSPVGPYFPTGLQPVRLFVSEKQVRAWPGGVGDAKVAPNYGPTILPQQQAEQAFGTAQVLYTFPRSTDPEEATVSEAGAMNIFFLLEKVGGGGLELVTPNLDGTILPGVTRDSVLQLACGWRGVEVSERPLTLGEIRRAAREGRLIEAFGTGTACIVQPVEALVFGSGEELHTRQGLDEPFAYRLHRALSDIQHARTPSPWSVRVE